MNAVKKRLTSGSNNMTSPQKEDLKNGRFPSSSSPNPGSGVGAAGAGDLSDLSPELVPIVTLLSSQGHRRYYEGIFMLYYDLNGDGKPADREWKEVYGILTGNQLAYWDAANLAEFRHNPAALLENSSKPNYINFTDSVYNAMKVLPAAKQNLDNVIIVSTTLKNRYIIQFKSLADLNNWYLALRLSNYEYQSLQLAYTGALLSARGSRLSDIKTILAEKRFDHEDWVSIRYGSGMAWKRCYAVVEPSISKRGKFTAGRILFYENDQKKKKQLMAVVTNCSAVCAVYPQAHKLIDHSTMLKLEGYINFKSPSLSTKIPKKAVDDFKSTSIFLMPEQHSSVPGFDTLIRFLVPLLDAFGLYGRPKRLKAERNDGDSLLFGLPTLPRVHYLELDDLKDFVARGDFLNWDVKAWNDSIKSVLKGKIDRGYEGCGSTRGIAGAVSSLSPKPSGSNGGSIKFPTQSSQKVQINQSTQPHPPAPPVKRDFSNQSNTSVVHNPYKPNLTIPVVEGPGSRSPPDDNHRLSEIYQKYSNLKSPSDQFNTNRSELLNGSHEELIEDALPSSVRKINLSENVYPKNDDELFSETDEEDDDGGSSSASDRIDSRQIGMLPTGSNSNNLIVPPYNNRNSSYSSVQSPMTQYNEFNEKFVSTVSPTTKRVQDFRTFSDSEPESPPPVPSHQVSSPYKHNNSSHPRIQKPNYINSPNASQNQFQDEELTGYREPPQQKNTQPVQYPQPVQDSQPVHHAPVPVQYKQTLPPPPDQYHHHNQPSPPPLSKNAYNQHSGSMSSLNQRPKQPSYPQHQPQPHQPQPVPMLQAPPQHQPQHAAHPYQQMTPQQQPQRRAPPQNYQPPVNTGVPPSSYQPQTRVQPGPQYHNTGIPPSSSGIPPSVSTTNTGIPPSATFNMRANVPPQRSQPQRQQAPNMRNYGNVPYQQYQYQQQQPQQIRPQGQQGHPQAHQGQQPPPAQGTPGQRQYEQQDPNQPGNPYARYY